MNLAIQTDENGNATLEQMLQAIETTLLNFDTPEELDEMKSEIAESISRFGILATALSGNFVLRSEYEILTAKVAELLERDELRS